MLKEESKTPMSRSRMADESHSRNSLSLSNAIIAATRLHLSKLALERSWAEKELGQRPRFDPRCWNPSTVVSVPLGMVTLLRELHVPLQGGRRISTQG
jgi:hypothetical protein